MADDSGEERTEQATEKRMKEVRGKGQLSQVARPHRVGRRGGRGRDAAVHHRLGRQRPGLDQLFTVARRHRGPRRRRRPLQALLDGFGAIGGDRRADARVVRRSRCSSRAVVAGRHPPQEVRSASSSSSTCVTGVKRIFGLQALWEGAKALLKTGVVALVLWSRHPGLMPVLHDRGKPAAARRCSRRRPAARVGARSQAAVGAGLVLGRPRRPRGDAPQPQEDADDQEGGQGREQEAATATR